MLLRGAVARTESLTARSFEAWLAGRFTLLASEAILAEVDAVLRRPEVLRKLDVTVLEARALVALLHRRALLVRPTVTIRRSRDPDDDMFLAWKRPSAGALERGEQPARSRPERRRGAERRLADTVPRPGPSLRKLRHAL